MTDKVLHYLQKLSIAYVAGSILFFGTVFAPQVFKVLPRESAAQLQNAIFPNFYLGQMLSLSIAMLSMVWLRRPRHSILKKDQGRPSLLPILICAIALIITSFSYLWIMPQLNALQSEAINLPSGQHPGFHFLHVLSVRLNMLVLFLSLLLI
jgi:uncharacterized protein with PQ loop repeat